MTEISKEAKHLILLVDFIDERVNQMDGRSLYEINNCIQLLRTRILAIQASVAELEYEQSADFDMGRVQGLEEAADLARSRHEAWTTASGVVCDVTACAEIADAIEALKEQNQ